MRREVLLLSGGLDSTAIAAWWKPAQCLFVDYGQVAAQAEHRAASQVVLDLGLRLDTIQIATDKLGVGAMAREPDTSATTPNTSPEWWPFRNQLLITIAASWAVTRGFATVLIGTVASDSSRHQDGSSDFLTRIDELVAMQEGRLHVGAPAHHLTTADLIETSGISDELLGWTHSCHRANLPCARCPGCTGREDALRAAARLQ